MERDSEQKSWNNVRGVQIDKQSVDLELIERNIFYVIVNEFKNIKYKELEMNQYGKTKFINK